MAFVCLLIPRRTIDRVGLLDERYCPDYGVEVLDYCESCSRGGLKVGVFDGCCVDHGSLTSSFRSDP
jgi:GT2 family glycosyltransferase